MSEARPPVNIVGRQVRAPKTAELIAGQLRSQIVRGILKEGDALPSEMGLMQQFGVSRPTLREAFRILESESLILVRRGSRGGVQVMAPDVSVAARYVGLLLQMSNTTLADLYETRTVIEPAAVGLLAQRRTKQDLKELSECVNALEDLVSKGAAGANLDQWSEAAYRFHDEIVARCGNQSLGILAGVLHEVVAGHMNAAVTRSADVKKINSQFSRTIESFRELIDLVDRKEAEEAEKFWRAHMEQAARKVLWGTLANESVVDLFNGWSTDVSYPPR